MITKQQALDYHSLGKPGKVEVNPTKPCVTQLDLSLAYTPGVADPCMEIHHNPADVYKYTAKGNLVAVVSNGTAVLGLGNIGAAAGKPVPKKDLGLMMMSYGNVYVAQVAIGASHNQSDMYWVEVGRSVEELGIPFTDRLEDAGKGPLVARHQDWRSVTNALIMCFFNNAPAQYHADLLNAITGRQETLESLLHIGERIWNLKRAFNCRLGLTRADDRLPKLVLQPLTEGGTQGHVPDLNLMLREYYQARGWDWDTGKPSREKLEELGLGWVVEDLWEGQVL